MTTTNTTLSDLKVGDACWRVNGVRDYIFLCRVTDIDGYNIGVVDQNKPDGNLFWYDRKTGRPAGWPDGGDSPLLVTGDDPLVTSVRAAMAERRKPPMPVRVDRAHDRYRLGLEAAVAKLPDDPEAWDEAFAALEAWEHHAKRA